MPVARRAVHVLTLLVLSAAGCSQAESAGTHVPAARDLKRQLHRRVAGWLAGPSWARPDGFVYAVELGQLMAYAALSRDRAMYVRLRQRLLQEFLIDDPDDLTTQGFVAWRRRPGFPPEASGTTEALRVAQALWLGSAAFRDPGDRALAARILRGYAAHAGEEAATWLIRNYFNLGTRAFATNSYLVDYDPDLLAEAARVLGDVRLQEIAERSYALLRQAVAPSGLLYEIIQPEVQTVLAHGPVVFSPNDIVHLANSCTVAERATQRAADLGRRILRFGAERRAGLHSDYLGRSGQPADSRGGGVEAHAALVRLAARLADPEQPELLAALLPHAAAFVARPEEPRLYRASEILLALELATPTAPLPPVRPAPTRHPRRRSLTGGRSRPAASRGGCAAPRWARRTR